MKKTNTIMLPSIDGAHLSASHPMKLLKPGMSKRPPISFMHIGGRTLSQASVQAMVSASRAATASEAMLFQRKPKY